jgi:hypothetical protein
MSQIPAFDPGIPVLTEVFVERPVTKEERAPLGSDASGQTPEPLETRAIDQWTGSEWALMERRLSERILHQLQGRVDFVLEQRLRDSMAEALQRAMAGLTDEIREGLQQTIGQIVARAVAQELAHLQTLKE